MKTKNFPVVVWKLFLLLSFIYPCAEAQIIEPLYPVPCSDIEYGGDNILWCVSQQEFAIKLDLLTGTTLDTVYFNILPDNDGRGAAWDGVNLWYSQWQYDTLYVIDLNNGNPVQKYNPPGFGPQGLAYGGGYIWHTDEYTESIYKIDPATGSVVGTLPNPETNGYFVGIAYYNGTLWLSNGITHNFFQIDTATGSILNNFNFESQGDITSDAVYLYFVSNGILHRKHLAGTNSFQLSIEILNGWNMVSVPGINPDGMGVDSWWVNRDINASVFRYLSGYQSVQFAVPGTGYWMKHSGANTYNTGDEWPAGGIQIVAHDPIAGANGWNLFGGYELSVSAANVMTVPAGLQSGPIYKYSGGYQVATTLDPGYGYWIKLSAAGQIIIPETLAKGEEPVEMFPENWGKIILTDATGVNYTLYAVNGEANLDQYELPPAPPAGMFDIRFSSGRIAEDINSSIKTIDMSGVTYPLTVRAEGMDMRLMDETGKTVNVNLKKGEDVVISDARIQKLMVSGEFVPAKYTLEQNYPNPFNPSTVIEFSLPEDVANVKLTIYTILGEKIIELVNNPLKAGKYKYQWKASKVATGMYIYELRTDNFISVKKMLLIK